MTLHMCPMGPAVQQFLAASSAILRSSASAAPFLPSSYQYSVLCTEVLKHDYLKRFDFQTLRTAFKLQYLPRVHGFRLKRFDKTCKLSILHMQLE